MPTPIKKIILHNIQSLPKAEIEPAPPGELTVIVGPSDSGKTTLASRAEHKLFFNTIPTKEIVRRGSKKASIAAVYDTPDNLTVAWCWQGRKTDAGKAWWEVRRDGTKPEVLAGSNRPGYVPEAIQNLTGVRPVKIGNLKLNMNFNKQLNGPFLGAAISPTERYRVLGALAGTLEVDAAEREVSTEILRARRREKELSNPDGKKKGKIEELDEKIAEFDYLDDLKQTIDDVESKLAAIKEKQELSSKLRNLQFELHAAKVTVLEKQAEIDFLGNRIIKAQKILSDAEFKASNYQKLFFLREQILSQREAMRQAIDTLKKTEKTGHIQLKIDNLYHTHNTRERLGNLLTWIDFQRKNIKAASQTLDATASTEKAVELLKRTTEANHKRGQLVSSLMEISKAREQIKRNSVILKRTSEVNRAWYILGLVEENIPRVKQLRELAARIERGRKFLAGVEATLKATQGFEKGMEVLAFVKERVISFNRLRLLRNQISATRDTVSQLTEKAKSINTKYEKTAQEYRELLRNAGICENCPVVDEVMAAAN